MGEVGLIFGWLALCGLLGICCLTVWVICFTFSGGLRGEAGFCVVL